MDCLMRQPLWTLEAGMEQLLDGEHTASSISTIAYPNIPAGYRELRMQFGIRFEMFRSGKETNPK